MTAPDRKTNWFIGTGVILVMVTVLLAFAAFRLRLEKNSRQPLPVFGQVAEFQLTTQDGHAITLADLRGHVWVADIIFTRCAGPCLKMTRQMKELQEAFAPDSQAKLVTLSTDPDFDTPPVLRAYAERFGANLSRWTFVTGSKREVMALARDSLKLTAIEKKPETRESPEDLFVHSTIFVIVDRQAQLRAIFESTREGTNPRQIKEQILAVVRQLEREG